MIDTEEWIVISENDLDSRCKPVNGYLRTYCHIHGSDNQRSLSINRKTGFGQCHNGNCGAHVLIREWNEEAAQNIERKQARVADGVVKVVDPRIIAHTAQRTSSIAPAPAIAKWQRDEVALLRALQDSMQSRLFDERARAYLAQRGVSLETASALGVGHCPDIALTGKYALLQRWADHIIFPVSSPDGTIHYVGRSLKLWAPGMNENEHKKALEDKEKALRLQAKEKREKGIEKEARALDREAGLYLRWYKTHSNGWFNFHALASAGSPVFCEGAFDALALKECGIDAIAIIGTALEIAWIPTNIGHVVLALDGDASGKEKSEKTRNALYERGYDVTICHAPDDDNGKDWNERYRLHGPQGVAMLQDALYRICHPSPSVPAPSPIVQTNQNEYIDSLNFCRCGQLVETFSDDGIPYCLICYEKHCTKLSPDEIAERFKTAFPDWTVTLESRTTLAAHLGRYTPEARDFWQGLREKLERQRYYEQVKASDQRILSLLATMSHLSKKREVHR